MPATPVQIPLITKSGNTGGTTSTAGLPSTAPVGSSASSGNGSYINVGTSTTPIWSQLAGGQNTDIGGQGNNTDATGSPVASSSGNASSSGSSDSSSPISSSSQFSTDPDTQATINSIINSGASYDQQMTALMQSVQGLSTAQAASILQSGQAEQQQLAAQQQGGDMSFQEQIQGAETAEGQALGNATVSGATANSTGTENMQTFSPYSPGGAAQGVQANSTYAGMKANISNQFQQTIGNLQSAQESYDASMAANETTAAAQTQANAIAASSAAIQNQLTIMQNMETVAQSSQSLTLQAETNSQNFQLAKASYQLQLQSNNQTLATGQLNTVLSQFAGTGGEGGFNALTPTQQNQINALATNAGIAPSIVQGMIDQKKATQFSTTTDALGNATLIGVDSAGTVVSQAYVGGGLSPTSAGGMAILAPYMQSSPSNPGVAVIQAPTLSGSGLKSDAVVSAAVAQGKTPIVLNTTQSATYQAAVTSLDGLNTVAGNVQSILTQPETVSQEVGGYLSNTAKAQLQSLNTSIMANNPEILQAIKASAGSSGSSGIGTQAIIGTDPSALINVNEPVATIMGNLQTFASDIISNGNSLGNGNTLFNLSSYPDLGSPNSSATSGTTHVYNGITYVQQNGQWVPQQ